MNILGRSDERLAKNTKLHKQRFLVIERKILMLRSTHRKHGNGDQTAGVT